MSSKPNLVIGLICAAGTDLSDVKQQLKAQLSVVGYNYKEIKVSSSIAAATNVRPSPDEFERMKSLMAAGDLIRKNSEGGSGVASLIVTTLRMERGDNLEDTATAFVIDSLKNPKELDILDQVYGGNFYSISVYSSEEARKLFLSNKIARSRRQALADEHSDLAQELIELDQKGEDESGQSVRRRGQI